MYDHSYTSLWVDINTHFSWVCAWNRLVSHKVGVCLTTVNQASFLKSLYHLRVLILKFINNFKKLSSWNKSFETFLVLYCCLFFHLVEQRSPLQTCARLTRYTRWFGGLWEENSTASILFLILLPKKWTLLLFNTYTDALVLIHMIFIHFGYTMIYCHLRIMEYLLVTELLPNEQVAKKSPTNTILIM